MLKGGGITRFSDRLCSILVLVQTIGSGGREDIVKKDMENLTRLDAIEADI